MKVEILIGILTIGINGMDVTEVVCPKISCSESLGDGVCYMHS